MALGDSVPPCRLLSGCLLVMLLASAFLHDMSSFVKHLVGSSSDPSSVKAAVFGSLRLRHPGVEEKVGTSPWRTANKTYICLRGRVLPILQVLGAQKAGSSTMFADLISTLGLRTDVDCTHIDVSNHDEFFRCKETHFFDFGRHKEYGRLWGACDTYSGQGVVADFTPDYLAQKSVPPRIAEVYGQFTQDIVFVVSVREPKQRMLSAFYDGIKTGWLYHNKAPPTFQAHVDAYLRKAHLANDWAVEHTASYSLYYVNLRRFLEAGYGAHQFIVFPGGQYLKHRDNMGTNPVLQAMRSRFGSSTLRPDVHVDAHQRTHEGKHSKLYELLNKSTVETLDREIFGPQNRAFAELLASQKAKGMVLVGYEGKAFDTQAVLAWLEGDWDF